MATTWAWRGGAVDASAGGRPPAGRDLGDAAALAPYARAHHPHAWPIYQGTNAIVRLYTDARPRPACCGKRCCKARGTCRRSIQRPSWGSSPAKHRPGKRRWQWLGTALAAASQGAEGTAGPALGKARLR